jgi:hypothetical protein
MRFATIRTARGRSHKSGPDGRGGDDLGQAVLVSRPRSHPIRLHGALTPNAEPRPSGATYF